MAGENQEYQALLFDASSGDRARLALTAVAARMFAEKLPDLGQTLNVVARLMAEAFGDACWVRVNLGESKKLRLVAARHWDFESCQAFRTWLDEQNLDFLDHALSRNPLAPQMVQVKLTPSHPARSLAKEWGIHSILAAPLVSREAFIGTLHLGRAREGLSFSPEDRFLLGDLATHAAIAIDNAILFDARADFVSIASHELKTPITALKMQIQLLSSQIRAACGNAVPESLRKSVEASGRQVDRLSYLIDDLLDLSRIHSGQLKLSLEVFDLSELIRETVENYTDGFARAGCMLKLKLEEKVLGCWDKSRLEQVLVNFITNALKYAPGREVTVSCWRMGGQVLFSVRDRGPGMSPEVKKRVFERFERGPNTRAPGLGLGLFICKKIVDAHYGVIHVESEPGRGAEFRVELPSVPI